MNRSFGSEDIDMTAKTCEFLSVLLNEKPTEAFVEQLRKNGAEFRARHEVPNGKGPLDEGICQMFQYVEATKDKTVLEVSRELAVSWTRIFRGIAPGYSPLPPCEAFYVADGNQEVQLKIFLELTKEYSTSGLVVDAMCVHRPDYVGVEMAFVHSFLKQEAAFLKEKDFTKAQECRESCRRFAANHLENWFPLFCKEAEKYSDSGFYQGLLISLAGFVSMLARGEEDMSSTCVH
ncbi:hypothetical protein SYK_15960 [Pseudodesulfovibrio nedwellii]|uniref:Molecular chaperone TorD n=1 Tax=Pseudodesulfovibrio nedwellii TaxID=2973072 RepID=A0ABN6S619_9BACT|nr:molecular chaperone TorD family protein [Pseudodesulfovibrio nedwellii]BDQ37236.1 hypothetical protein SYK_15960 [Pseudodesulfovibrio nedwellii]